MTALPPFAAAVPASAGASAYRAPRWLPGPHAQTIWPALWAPRPRVSFRRERWDTPDDDFVDVDFLANDAAAAGDQNDRRPDGATLSDTRPMLIVFHGLEGGSGSHYASALMDAALHRGWRGAVPHFRGCSGEPNRLPRAYHSGDSEEIDWMLREFHRRLGPDTPLLACGISLGGNALLKWLGERGSDAHRLLRAAAGVSAPQDLEAGAHSLSRGFSRAYTYSFMRTLRRKSVDKLQRFPGLYDPRKVMAARTFFEFDELVTAPLHGFAGCHDYWRRSSCKQFLPGIDVPTLVLNARNDPFVPAGILARADEVSRQVRLDYPDEGGHVGFLAGTFPGHLDWLPARVMHFFDHG